MSGSRSGTPTGGAAKDPREAAGRQERPRREGDRSGGGGTAGRSAAYIAGLVNRAAQHALHRVTEEGGEDRISERDVRAALDERLGSVDVTQEQRLGWDDLVLPEAVPHRLQVLLRLVEAPDRAQALGVLKIPRGVMLFGPPRTRKMARCWPGAGRVSSPACQRDDDLVVGDR